MPEDPTAPRFSIVVPAFNEADFIGATLHSLTQQDYRGSYEVIVVDNNSTDATRMIAESYEVRVEAETRPGVCFARQRGLDAARGDIVISTDADTIYPRDWLRRIETAFDTGEGVVGVGGPCRYRHPAWWVTAFATLLFGTVRLVYRTTGWVGYVTATNTAFRRPAFDGYNLTLTQGGDELDVLRRLRKKGRVVWLPDNIVETSPRRQDSGVLHTFFVSFLWYYLIAYNLNRIAARTVLGMAPNFRRERLRHSRPARWGVGIVVVLVASVGVARLFLAR